MEPPPSPPCDAARRAHLVVFPFPAQGHILPALQLSLRLASHGVCITFINTPSQIAHLHSQASSFGPNIHLLALPEAPSSTSHSLPSLCSSIEALPPSLSLLLSSLLLHSHPWPPPLCLVTDAFLGWAQDVADHLQLPRFILFTPPASVLVLMLQLPHLISQQRLPYRPHDPTNSLLNLPGLTPNLLLSDIPSHLLLDPSEFMYGYFIRHAKRVPDASGILLNTFYELETPAIDAARAFWPPLDSAQISAPSDSRSVSKRISPHPLILPIGPLLPSQFFDPGSKTPSSTIGRVRGPQDDLCLSWLGEQDPNSVLYVSFGSLAVLSAEQIHEIAYGLEGSEQPFLWVLRSDDSTHEQVLPQGFIHRASGRRLVVEWAPQLEVLSHRSTGCFLSHCGWNSSLESICAGVAMLAWPIFAEQKMNCRFLVDEAKVALEFKRGDKGLVGREEVERVIRLAMKSQEGALIKAKVKELKESATKAVRSTGSSYTSLGSFLDIISGLNLHGKQ